MAKLTLGTNAFTYLGFDEQDLEDLEALADDRGGYWVTAFTFVAQLKDKVGEELSFKQTSWAVDIIEKLVDLRRKGKI